MATETRSPGTLADDAGTGTLTWTNPGNAGASDNTYATVSGGPGSIAHYLKGTNFGFVTIGDSDTLTQLKLRFERKKSSGGTIKDDKVYLVIGGTIQTGTNYADTVTAYPGTDTYAEYTISSGLPTVAQLKASGFGFVVSCKDTTGFAWGVDGDHMEVVATYTVADPKVVTPATAALVTTGFAPTIRLNKIAQPPAAGLVLTTFAPTVVRTGGSTALPAAASLVVTGFAPTIRLGTIARPAAAALSLTPFAPAAVLGTVAAPATGPLALTGYAPTVRLDKIVQPAAAALSLTPFAPAARSGPYVTPATGSLALTGYAPTVRTPRVARPARLPLTLTPFAPRMQVEREWQIQRLTLHDG